VPFPREGPSVRPDTKLFPAKYKGGIHWRFSSDRPINDVLLSLHFLILFLFFLLLAPHSFPLALVHRRGAARSGQRDVSSFAIKMAICFEAIRRKSLPFLRHGAITSRNDRSPRIHSGYMEACFQIVTVAIRVSSARVSYFNILPACPHVT